MKQMLSISHQTLKNLRNVNQTKWVDLLRCLRDLYSQSFISFWRTSCVTRMQLTLSGFPTPSITGREEVLCVRFQGDLWWEYAPSNQPRNWKCCDYVCSEPPQDLVAVGKWWVELWLQTRQLLIFFLFLIPMFSTILSVCSVKVWKTALSV